MGEEKRCYRQKNNEKILSKCGSYFKELTYFQNNITFIKYKNNYIINIKTFYYYLSF